MTTAKIFLALFIGAAILSALGFSRRIKHPTPNIRQIIEDGNRREQRARQRLRPRREPVPGMRVRTR